MPPHHERVDGSGYPGHLGGETLHNFAIALTIGICFGIYSSVLVASPLVMWLGVSRENFIKVNKQIEGANKDGAVV